MQTGGVHLQSDGYYEVEVTHRVWESWNTNSTDSSHGNSGILAAATPRGNKGTIKHTDSSSLAIAT